MKKFAVLVLAALPALLYAQSDDFEDGNDNGWTHYNVIGVGSYTVANGGYRLRTSPSPNPAIYGPGRTGALHTDITYTDFYISVDIVNWDTNLNQAFGILARCTDIGPGSTDGYALTWDRGGRDLDISIFTNEVPANVPGQAPGNADLKPGKIYRMIFMGQGTRLTGEIYELPNLDTPLASIGCDSDRWPSGVCGLIVYDNTSAANGTTDTTFDNYLGLPSRPPRLKIESLDFGDIRISWPADPTNYVLQATSTLGVDWTDITENIGESGGIRSYTDSSYVQDLRFYRLRP